MRRAILIAALVLAAVPVAAEDLKRLEEAYFSARRGAFEAAVRLYGEAIRTDKLAGANLVRAYLGRANALVARGDYRGAIEDYGAALKLDAEPALVWYNRGVARYYHTDHDGAIADMGEVLKRNPESAPAHFMRGVAHVQAGRAKEGVAEIGGALKLDPGDPYAVLWEYIALARLRGDAAGALAARLPALDLTRWPGPLVRLYAGSGSAEAVLEAVAGETGPELRCEAFFFLGQHQLARGDKAGGAARLREALATRATAQVEYHAARLELAALAASTR